MIELALAREQVKTSEHSLLPSVLTDDKFQALMEELCGRNDAAAFTILLERLRDELVEDGTTSTYSRSCSQSGQMSLRNFERHYRTT
jgi:signal transduction histidine kinase